MAGSRRTVNVDGVDRNGLALFVFLLTFVVCYVISALIMAALLESS